MNEMGTQRRTSDVINIIRFPAWFGLWLTVQDMYKELERRHKVKEKVLYVQGKIEMWKDNMK